MVASAHATLQFLDLLPGNSALLCMDLKHIGAKMMVVRALVGGLQLHFTEPSKSPLTDIMSTIDFAALVPIQALNSINQLHQIKKTIIGGAPLSREEILQLANIDSEIYQTFGMTETISHIALKKISKKDAYYRLLPGISIKQSEKGNLIISAERLGIDHLETNDLIEIRGTDSFEWMGRADFIINSGGVKINPEEIENLLSPYITGDYAISWKPDDRWGQKVVLVLEKSSVCKSLEKINLEKYKLPKTIVTLDELPRTVNGKLKRIELAQLIATKKETLFFR